MKNQTKKSIEQIALDNYSSAMMEKRIWKIAKYLGIISVCLSFFLSVFISCTTTNTIFEVITLFFLILLFNGFLIMVGLSVPTAIYLLIMETRMKSNIIAALSEEDKIKIIIGTTVVGI